MTTTAATNNRPDIIIPDSMVEAKERQKKEKSGTVVQGALCDRWKISRSLLILQTSLLAVEWQEELYNAI